nr:MAG TPA: hypothetical protein [Bacteriophage sp.]
MIKLKISLNNLKHPEPQMMTPMFNDLLMN